MPGRQSMRPTRDIFLAMFSAEEQELSSTLRELLGVLRCLKNAIAKNPRLKRVIFACDNYGSVNAIRFGSRTPAIQRLAEQIFRLCLQANVVCWPVWLPRTNAVIVEADRRSRLTIPHDLRTPQTVVDFCNRLAIAKWGQQLSFDQAASHVSAIKINGKQLPFNAFCRQPDASGVDMFLQKSSWTSNINFVHPPRPMTGRLLAFLQYTESRSIITFPDDMPTAWWSFMTQPNSAGLVARHFFKGFMVLAFDFSAHRQRGTAPRAP